MYQNYSDCPTPDAVLQDHNLEPSDVQERTILNHALGGLVSPSECIDGCEQALAANPRLAGCLSGAVVRLLPHTHAESEANAAAVSLPACFVAVPRPC
jgi:hypothetical protein